MINFCSTSDSLYRVFIWQNLFLLSLAAPFVGLLACWLVGLHNYIEFTKLSYICDMKKDKHKIKESKGLSDTELVQKYESGTIDLKHPVKRLLKTPSNSSVLKDKKRA